MTGAGIARRNHGRNHSYTIDGAKVPGVTKIAGMAPKDALIGWAGNTTAAYAVDYWAELSRMRPSARLERLRRARFEDRDAAANRGTQVHRLGESLVIGEEVDVPDELAGHVASYVDFLDRTELKPVAVELVVGNREVRYCGTLDLIGDLPALTWCGEEIPPARWLLDLKTSRSGIYRESALQLCGYRRAEVYLEPDTGAERPMEALGIERAAAVHVRADGWDMRPVDTGDEVWAYFRHLAWLYHHDEATADYVHDAIDPPPLPGAPPAGR